MANQRLLKAKLDLLVGMTRWWACEHVYENTTHYKIMMRDTQSGVAVSDDVSKKSINYVQMYKDVFGPTSDKWSGQAKPATLHLVCENGKKYARFVFYDPCKQ